MIPILKNTASSGRLDGGRDQARGALTSKRIIQQSPNFYKYNLIDLLPTESPAWTIDDINRVKNAVIGYCKAMDAGDTATMLNAAGILQRLARQGTMRAITTAYDHYAHSDYEAGKS